MLIQLIYVSSASRLMNDDDLKLVLDESIQNNSKQNVTGMLLYASGNFIQVLEGEEQDIEDTYKRIEKDPRHKGAIIIEKSEIKERNFPNWSMGFQSLNAENMDEMDGFNEFLTREMEPHEFANKRDDIVELLYQFKQNSN